MPRLNRHLLLFSVAGRLAACGASAPAAPVVELTPAGDTLATPYSEVTEAAWLGGNRWAVLAPADNAVAIVDFGTKTIAPLGGEQVEGAAKSIQPVRRRGHPVRGRLGTTPADALDSQRPAGPLHSGLRRVPGQLAPGRDAAGRFYLDLYPHAGAGRQRQPGLGRRRASRSRSVSGGHHRTAGSARHRRSEGDAGRRFERRVFSGVDRWGVLPDGSLWMARVYDNRVDWRGPDGRWSGVRRCPIGSSR